MDRLLTPTEIDKETAPVLKGMAESFSMLGKRFIDDDITYKEYQELGNKLSMEYESLYKEAIAKAQDANTLKSVGEWLDVKVKEATWSKRDVEACIEALKRGEMLGGGTR